MTNSEEIYVLNKAVRLLQPPDGFRTSLDSVMLAAACPAQGGNHVLDLGCGVGSASFCLLYRVRETHLTGIDIQADHVELARRNAVLNEKEGRAEFLCADIKSYGGGKFDHVICNPPFLESGTYLPSPSEKRATALAHRDEGTMLKHWLDAAFRNLKNGGSFTIIHRADHTDKIIQGLGKRFGAVEIIPLWPRTGQPAKRVIIRALKNRKTPASLHPGLTLHEADGGYTQAADAALREAKALI